MVFPTLFLFLRLFHGFLLKCFSELTLLLLLCTAVSAPFWMHSWNFAGKTASAMYACGFFAMQCFNLWGRESSALSIKTLLSVALLYSSATIQVLATRSLPYCWGFMFDGCM